MSTLNCPQCGQLDKVQKVSALYTQGTSRTSYETPSAAVQINDTTFYGTQERTAVSRTALSERLAPPTRSNLMKPIELTYKLGVGTIVTGIIVVILALLGLLMLIAGLGAGLNGGDWSGGVIGAFMILPIFLFIRDIFKVRNGKAKQEYESKMNAYNKAMSNHNSAQQQWDSAYYCGRCDGVFSLGSGKLTPINEFYKFLNKYGV